MDSKAPRTRAYKPNLYRAVHSNLDRDDDHIACEKQAKGSRSSVDFDWQYFNYAQEITSTGSRSLSPRYWCGWWKSQPWGTRARAAEWDVAATAVSSAATARTLRSRTFTRSAD